MTSIFKLDARKIVLTTAVAAAFLSANPLIMHGAFFGGEAHAAQSMTGHDHDDSAKVATSSQSASASTNAYVAPAIADDDMDGDNALTNTDKKNESTYCNGHACR
jgi:hypothetical protein